MKIGFTGTQRGMTQPQKAALHQWLIEHEPSELHHGDCLGADAQVHGLCCEELIQTVLHPPINPAKRAFCASRRVRTPKPYLVRNKDIVDDTDMLIATPGEMIARLRSGTWSTVRYAAKTGKRSILVFPDGTIDEE